MVILEEDSNCAESRAKGTQLKDTCVGASSNSLPIEEEEQNPEQDFVDLEDDEDDTIAEEPESGTSTQKSKKLTSKAWDYFDKIKVKGVPKAQCKHCKKVLSAGSNGGTSHLLKHAGKVCSGRHLRLGVGQRKLKVVKEDDGTTTLELKAKGDDVFDQDVSRRELLNMIVMHEYPLSIVDHMGFRRFVESLNSKFKMISRNTLRSDVMKVFQSSKTSLKELLVHNSSRIAITTDMWTASNQRKGFMVVTSHFIDEQWILRNRTLRFSYVPCPHTSPVLAKILMDCLTQYCIANKISSVVVDNCTTNDAMMSILGDEFEPKSLILGGSFLHMRCAAHILNLIVKDGLDVIDSGVEKIRDCVAFWTLTPKRIEKFSEACQFLQLSSSKMLALDCKTRWNSAFLMLQTAIPYKEVFDRLKRLNKRLKFVVPSEKDWEIAELVCDKLELFYKTTKAFSGRKYPTANLFFRRICGIRLSLRSWLQSDSEVIRKMASNMIEKFDKYWKEANGLLAIATILDPRNKMDCVDYYFQRIYNEGAELQLDRIRGILAGLLIEYQKGDVGIKEQEQGGSSTQPSKASMKRKSPDGFDDEDEFARAKRTKQRKVNVRCELEHYLDEETLPDDIDFDVLEHWKKDHKYPTLRKIARDILAIPISTVASESAFSMSGRVISPHRSRLHAKTVEALMCLQNWMTQDAEGVMGNPYAYATIDDDSDDEDPKSDVIDMDVDVYAENEGSMNS